MSKATKHQLDIATVGQANASIVLTPTVRKVGTKMQDFYTANIQVGNNTFEPVGDNGVDLVFPTKDAAINWLGSASNDNLFITVAIGAGQGSILWKKPLYATVALKNAALKTKLQAGVVSATTALAKATATKNSYTALGYDTSLVPAVVAMVAANNTAIANINANITELNAKIATL
jgi:hypothetical protein